MNRRNPHLVLALLTAVIMVSLFLTTACGSNATSGATTSAAGSITTGSSTSEAPAETTYEFGAMFPMTGPAAFIGELFVAAVNEAVDEINASGGVDGMMLKVDVEDHAATAKGGADAMNKIVLNKNIAFAIGSFVDPNLAAQPIAAQNKVIIMNAGGQADALLNKDYLWNNHVMASYQMPPLARYVYDKGFRKVASIIQDTQDGYDNRDAFFRVWKSLGGTVVADEKFGPADTDFVTQLTKIKATNPDVIYINAVALQAATLLKQIKELKITAQICGAWIDDPATLMPAGNNADGAISISTYLDPKATNPFAANFIKTYKEKYGPQGAGAYWPWANAYENVYILKELITRVKAKGGDIHSGEQLLAALQADPKFESVFGQGSLTFNLKEHDVLKDVAISTIENGQGVVQKVIPYSDLKPE
jgi:branched-chain amino acid transport system substrate-binding protein